QYRPTGNSRCRHVKVKWWFGRQTDSDGVRPEDGVGAAVRRHRRFSVGYRNANWSFPADLVSVVTEHAKVVCIADADGTDPMGFSPVYRLGGGGASYDRTQAGAAIDSRGAAVLADYFDSALGVDVAVLNPL